MKCASCGTRIKGDPVWVDDEPYCSEECAGMEPSDDEEIEYEEDKQDAWGG